MDEGIPGGDAGAGEGRSLLVGESGGYGHEGVLRKDAVGGENAVIEVAHGGTGCCVGERTVDPSGEEARNNTVARAKAGDGRAHGDHFACAVGAKRARLVHFGVVHAADDHEIAVVEGDGVDADEHFVGAGFRQVDGAVLQGFNGEVVGELEGFGLHGVLDATPTSKGPDVGHDCGSG